MLKIAVIGAGSTYTPELAAGIFSRKDIFPVTELSLMDIDERKLSVVGGLVERMAAHEGGRVKVTKTMNLDTALSGASFVMAQIRVGKLPARHLDESIPLRYGLIGQETTGIGGFFKGLRTIPVMMDVARHIEKCCPDAWLINFSNPSGMIAEALLRFTDVRMMGLCNIPIATIAKAREAVGDPEAAVETVGLNHLSWVTSVKSRGEEKIHDLIQKGYSGEKPKNLPESEFSVECLRAAGGIPCGYLLYYYDREARLVQLQKAEKTRAQVCMEIEEELLALYSDPNLAEKPALLDKRGGHMYSEAAVWLAEAIYNDTGAAHTVNTQNGGVLPYLQPDEAAEIACSIGKNGPKPLPVENTGTAHIKGLMQAVKAYERLATEAAIWGDRDAALAALMVHPLVGDFDRAKSCFAELLEAHARYLPNFYK